VGNAGEILGWLTRTCSGDRTVVEPATSNRKAQLEVIVDHVGNLDNAAMVISRLHRGEKRLAFVDSRARTEELAASLRDRDVETYVSHGSLGRDERRAAEKAFATSRDCVIVATSTLELGIDVGDLDRVIQIDAPATVASFLQRLGRTGRREGLSSNTLFLTTDDDAFLQCMGLLRCWEDGFVEPLEPPPLPLHLLVQQLLALVLQEEGVGRHTWRDWYGQPFVFGTEVAEHVEELTAHLLENRFLFEDNGVLGIGEQGEKTFGGRNFLDLMAVFSEPPMLTVMVGRTELGHVPVRLLTVEQRDGHVLLLAGRSWDIIDVDWRRGVVRVEPSNDRGKVRWFGDGRGLSFELCQGMRQVIAGRDLEKVTMSRRAVERLTQLQGEFGWIGDGEETTMHVAPDGSRRWWTFAGTFANIWLVNALGDLSTKQLPGDLNISLAPGVTGDEIRRHLDAVDTDQLQLGAAIARGAVDRLKFADALPEAYARRVVERRMRADQAVRQIASWPVRQCFAV
jgi:ATP-dependent Lhr-like helicase